MTPMVAKSDSIVSKDGQDGAMNPVGVEVPVVPVVHIASSDEQTGLLGDDAGNVLKSQVQNNSVKGEDLRIHIGKL